MTWLGIVLLVLVLLAVLYVALACPHLPRRPLNKLAGWDYAHRGLWNAERPENSLAAFKAAVDAAMQVGLPEACMPLSDAVVLVSLAPKSNTAHNAYFAALADVQAGKAGPIPRQLQNKHYDGEDAAVKGQHYLYPHDYPGSWVDQQYLPDALRNAAYYVPGNNKNEQAYQAYWAAVREKYGK